MNTLYLTPSEQLLFQSLSADLQEGWVVEPETLSYADTHEKQQIRIALMRVHDPKLLAVREQIRTASTMEAAVSIINDTDLAGIDEDDIASLFFALGPVALSQIIALLLTRAQSDTEIEQLTALTVIRHAQLEAFHSVRS